MASLQNGPRGPVSTGAGSWRASTRRLARWKQPKISATDLGYTTASPSARWGPIEVGVGHPEGVVGLGVEQQEGRVGERADQGGTGAQHAVDLAEDPVEVALAAEFVDGDGAVDGVGADEGQLGDVAVVELEAPFEAFGAIAGDLESPVVAVDHDHVSTLAGESHGGLSASGAEHEEPLRADLAEQPQAALVGDVGPVGHDVVGEVGVIRREPCGGALHWHRRSLPDRCPQPADWWAEPSDATAWIPSGIVSFGPGVIKGAAAPGEIDYRLARQHLVAEYRRGRLAEHEVCDAHPELVRAAREVGDPSRLDCPICEEHKLVLVSYVFGPRLPSYGRCITSAAELKGLARRSGEFSCYVVEVCPECHWNHLARTFVLNPARSA